MASAPSLPFDKSLARKQRYVDAAVEELMTRGITDLSLRELASRMGTSHRMLIYHFGSKDGLISEAVSEVRRREREQFSRDAAQSEDSSPAGALRRFYSHNLSDDMRPYFALFYEVWGIAQAHPDRYRTFLEGIVSVWVELLADALERGGIDRRAAVSRATLALAAMRGLQFDLYSTGDRDRVDEAFAGLVDLIGAERPPG